MLTTDASKYAIGGVLSQGPIGQNLPIAYASRTLNSAEGNYATIEKELLAITYCVHHFRPYLYGCEFTLVTDHQPLIWLYSVKDPTSRLMRWRLKLEEYNYKIIYKKGSLNRNADALSRNPSFEATVSDNKVKSVNYSKLTQVLPIRKKRRLDSSRESVSSDDDEYFDESTQIKRIMTRNAKLQARQQRLQSEITENIVPESNAQKSPENTLPWNDRLRQLPRAARLVRDTMTQDTSNEPPPIIDLSNSSEHLTEYPPEPPLPSPPFLPPSDLPALPESPNPNDSDDNEVTMTAYEFSDESDLSDSEEEQQQPQPLVSLNIRENRDDLLNHKDNLVVLVSADGYPFDEGAKYLSNLNKLPEVAEPMLGRARVFPSENTDKNLIILVVKERRSTILDFDILVEALHSLLDVILELNLKSFSIAKTDCFNGIPWNEFYTKIAEIFVERPIIITICLNFTRVPPVEERPHIIAENHASTFGGHQGITKTFHRIRQNYYWEHLKRQIVEYIRQCRTCQLKKLVRLKTRQPMILTDTPGAAFDKVALDILGPLPRTDNKNGYLLTIQDVLTK